MRYSRLAALLIAASISVPALAAESIAVVNGVAIDKNDVDQAVNFIIRSSNGQAQDTPALREDVKNRLINREVILQEAKNRGLDKNPEVARQITQATQDIQQDALFASFLKQNPVDESRILARYKEVTDKLSGTQEVHALQITLKTEEDARKVIADLKKGSRFEQLVKTRSTDPASRENNGDMGYGNMRNMAQPLAEALKLIHKGQFSQQPFHSNIGWHVFKVVDIRTARPPELDKVKAQIVRQLQEEQIAQAVNDLRSKAKIQ